jgi:hypothetical protein
MIRTVHPSIMIPRAAVRLSGISTCEKKSGKRPRELIDKRRKGVPRERTHYSYW